MIAKQAISWVRDQLSVRYDQQQRSLLAHQLVGWALKKTSAELIAHPELPVSDQSRAQLSSALEEHLIHKKPLQYIFGTVPFLTASISVRPPILIPRPETEQWCNIIGTELQKKDTHTLTLLDMCTGSGCVAIGLAQALPGSTIYAIDSSPRAIALTQENIHTNQCNSVIAIRSDLFEHIPSTMRFDCIVSNPPYISSLEWETLDPMITQWEDQRALHADEQGLSIIKRLIEQAPHWLTPVKHPDIPHLLIEIGETQGKAVMHLMSEAGFDSQIHQDDAGKDRFVIGRLLNDS